MINCVNNVFLLLSLIGGLQNHYPLMSCPYKMVSSQPKLIDTHCALILSNKHSLGLGRKKKKIT